MKRLLARSVGSGISLAGFLTRSAGVGLWLTLAACQPSDHSQEAHTALLPSGQVTTANLSCSSDWMDRRAEPIKITDSLIVSVPMKYIEYEMRTCGKMTGGIPRAAPLDSTSISFDFFMPDFGGFTTKTLREPYPFNKVHVAYVASAASQGLHPSDPAKLESDQLKEGLPFLANTGKYEDLYGLRCYEGKPSYEMVCYGSKFGKNHYSILFIIDVPKPGSRMVNPLMRTDYFASRYGGIRIDWWTSARNLSHWREIDGQIWNFLAAWNAAPTAKNAKSHKLTGNDSGRGILSSGSEIVTFTTAHGA